MVIGKAYKDSIIGYFALFLLLIKLQIDNHIDFGFF